MKRCSRCRKNFPLHRFGRNRSKPDGLDSYCKVCRAEIHREHYWRNREKRIESARRWREKNPDYFRQ